MCQPLPAHVFQQASSVCLLFKKRLFTENAHVFHCLVKISECFLFCFLFVFNLFVYSDQLK